MGELKIYDYLSQLANWDNIPDLVLDKLNGTCFDNLLKLKHGEHIHNLLEVCLDYYDVYERCFIFNEKKVFIGLEDVLYITGLPIHGDPFILDARQIDWAKQLLDLPYEFEGGCVPLKLMRETFKTIDENSDGYLRPLLLCKKAKTPIDHGHDLLWSRA
ncbi:hypothetical protein COLO4_15129 [Corchorus olitorius]|uniref:Aminotransferase-like plant mobile domain-containing protein n=1 Tax=Corchorus olitorius TaxID=93759 RepID=A0A1R3JPB4_9ROSI|nr:hypothetical protein COLO4_15129 [Corchorus olitorius]